MSLGGGAGGGADEELRELSEQLQALEDQIEALGTEQESLRNRKRRIDEAIEALGDLESGSTVQVPVAEEAYVRAEITDVDRVTVDIGGGYAAERDADGAVDTLENRKETIDDRIDELGDRIAELESESDELEDRAVAMQRQQMQQRMGGGPDRDE
jgi:prefoldin alpha subunit